MTDSAVVVAAVVVVAPEDAVVVDVVVVVVVVVVVEGCFRLSAPRYSLKNIKKPREKNKQNKTTLNMLRRLVLIHEQFVTFIIFLTV